MGDFPTLIEEDFRQFDGAMKDLLSLSGADFAILIEKAGYRIHVAGNAVGHDTDTLATLAANSFAATNFLTGLLQETHFSGMYQQGQRVSTLILNIDESCLLLVVFQALRSVGAVKYFAHDTLKRLAEQLRRARERAPERQVDLASLNPHDIGDLFSRTPHSQPEAMPGTGALPPGTLPGSP